MSNLIPPAYGGEFTKGQYCFVLLQITFKKIKMFDNTPSAIERRKKMLGREKIYIAIAEAVAFFAIVASFYLLVFLVTP